MDIFTLVVTIIGSLISIVVDLYFIILYTHKEEPLCRPISILCKILILITLLQVQLQPLFLLFDVNSSKSSSTDFTILWFVVFFSILVNIAFLKPLLSSLYEADEDDPCWKTVLWTIVQVVITMGVFGAFLAIGWVFWGKIYLPVIEITAGQVFVPNSTVTQTLQSGSFQILTSVPIFLIGMLCLIGYPILACCGALGMTALPFSFIMQFKNRPKWRRTTEAKSITDELKIKTVSLIKQADRLKRSATNIEFSGDGWFQRRKKNNEIQTSISQIQTELQRHRDFYELFRLELQMQNVNPWVYILKLVVGIICLIFTPLWLVQMQMFYYFRLLVQLVYRRSIFLDKFLVWLQENGASFMSVTFILILTFYMIFAVLKGIFFFSQAVPFIKIHPVVQGKTWLNSLMFQTNIAVMAATALLHLLITTFPEYLRGGDIVLIMGTLLQSMLFVGVFMSKKVFIYIFLIMSVLGAFFVAFWMFCLNHKSDQMKKIEEMRKKMFGKQNKNKEIQMTQMHLDPQRKKEKQKQKSGKKARNKGITIDNESVHKQKSSKSKIRLELV